MAVTKSDARVCNSVVDDLGKLTPVGLGDSGYGLVSRPLITDVRSS